MADRAFVLKGQGGAIWMAVGKPTSISFVGMQQQAATIPEEEDVSGDDGGDLDFGMM